MTCGRALSLVVLMLSAIALAASDPASARTHRRSHPAASGGAGSVSGGAAAGAELPETVGEVCGGTERWPVKVGSDPAAAEIDIGQVQAATIAQMNAVKPTETIALTDETTRMTAEKQVYRVGGDGKAYLGFFKYENGATGDQDYHLVITDRDSDYTEGGTGTEATGHSFVAEIPNPACIAGKQGDANAASAFARQIAAARACFEKNTASVRGSDIPAGSIPVIVTGIAFFDRDHGQVGRSLPYPVTPRRALVRELHPVLKIEFPEGQACED